MSLVLKLRKILFHAKMTIFKKYKSFRNDLRFSHDFNKKILIIYPAFG